MDARERNGHETAPGNSRQGKTFLEGEKTLPQRTKSREQNNSVGCEAPKTAKLVQITPMSLWFMVLK